MGCHFGLWERETGSGFWHFLRRVIYILPKTLDGRSSELTSNIILHSAVSNMKDTGRRGREDKRGVRFHAILIVSELL